MAVFFFQLFENVIVLSWDSACCCLKTYSFSTSPMAFQIFFVFGALWLRYSVSKCGFCFGVYYKRQVGLPEPKNCVLLPHSTRPPTISPPKCCLPLLRPFIWATGNVGVDLGILAPWALPSQNTRGCPLSSKEAILAQHSGSGLGSAPVRTFPPAGGHSARGSMSKDPGQCRWRKGAAGWAQCWSRTEWAREAGDAQGRGQACLAFPFRKALALQETPPLQRPGLAQHRHAEAPLPTDSPLWESLIPYPNTVFPN